MSYLAGAEIATTMWLVYRWGKPRIQRWWSARRNGAGA